MTYLTGKYRAHSLIPGHKVGPDHKGKTLVAVPEKLLERDLLVSHGIHQYMHISKGTKSLHSQTFPDKYTEGKTYTLHYFEWEPSEQIRMNLNPALDWRRV